MPGEAKPEVSLKREIGSLGIGTLTLNGQIGAGIFALPAIAVAQVGAFSPWMYVICTFLIMTMVLSFARAAGFFRSTGGPIVYATSAFGPFAGFQTGWLLSLSRVAAFAANSNLLVTYASWFWPTLEAGTAHALAVVFVCLALTALNVFGVRRGVHALYLLTALKLLPLVLVVVMGMSYFDPASLLNVSVPGPRTLGETTLILMYAFIGFESAVIPAGEARNPRKDIPRAMIGTVIVTAAIYILIQIACVSVKPDLGTSSKPIVDVAEILMGPVGAALLTLGAVFSIGGNLSASMMTAPRMIYALARDRSLPAWFGQVHRVFSTPANAIIFYGALALALALSGSFVWLAVMSTLARLLSYMVSIAALPRLGKIKEGSFRLPGGYAIPVLAFVLCLWLIAQASIEAWMTALAFSLAGSVLYAYSRRKKPQLAET